MRLQVTVQRHELPPVRFVFNTASRHTPSAQRLTTVSDLLSAVHAFVPLESNDGEWGLEDYTVEVSARAGQESTYECFHFQELKDVLREDDEVVIRGLSNDELRERRRGGRLQITSDGRHLFDGLSWGRRWYSGQTRPGIEIPPRKRRKLLIESDDVQVELPSQPGQELIRMSNEVDEEAGDDDDDDDDYHDYGSDDEEEASNFSEDSDMLAIENGVEEALQTESSGDDTLREIEVANLHTDGLESTHDHLYKQENMVQDNRLAEIDDVATELQDLINDASDITQSPISRKRKRKSSARVNGISPKSVIFEGFLSSPKLTQSDDQEGTLEALAAAEIPEPNAVNVESESDSTDDSNSSSSDSGESDSSSSSDVSEDASELNSDGESSEDSDSGESTSSDETSQSFVRSAAETSSAQPLKLSSMADQSQMSRNATSSKSVDGGAMKPNVPPGSGSNKTKRHNERVKRRKMLMQLKSKGELSENANFEDLRSYLQKSPYSETVARARDRKDDVQEEDDDFTARKQEILQRLHAIPSIDEQRNEEMNFTQEYESDGAAQPPHINLLSVADISITAQASHDSIPGGMNSSSNLQDKQPSLEDSTMTDAYTAQTSISEPKAQATSPNSQVAMTPDDGPTRESSKRAKLDLGSSRRMLFNALGVRTPKTAADEQALREKLSKSVRQPKVKEASLDEKQQPNALRSDAWKSKLTIVAVECDAGRRQIDTPSFPFKHPWQIRKEREKQLASIPVDRDDSEIHQHAKNKKHAQQRRSSQAVIASSDIASVSQSATSFQAKALDDAQYPSNYEALPALELTHLVQGNIIAFRELHLSSRVEPEPSPYRVAKVISNENGHLRLQLLMKDLQQDDQQGDENADDRVLKGFEMSWEGDEDDDDGVRGMTFGEMIDPKLVKQVQLDVIIPDSLPEPMTTESQAPSDLGPTSNDIHADADPELPQVDGPAMRLSPPRRAIIDSLIKNAGFNSPLNKQLLEPLLEPSTLRAELTLKEVTPRAKNNTAPDSSQHEKTDEDEWLSTTEPVTSPVRPVDDQSYMPTSSPPSESIVNSVRYPHLSHLESDTSPPAVESSSHQDAQRRTPTPLVEIEQTTLLDDASQDPEQESNRVSGQSKSQGPLQNAKTNSMDLRSSSLPSEIPQTQFTAANAEPNTKQAKTEQAHKDPQSDQLRDHAEQQYSSYNPHDISDYGSDDSLPSISELTSSQPFRSKGKQKPTSAQPPASTAPTTVQERASASASALASTSPLFSNPAPRRRSPRATRKPLLKYKTLADSEEASANTNASTSNGSSSTHLPPLMDFKLSQSQLDRDRVPMSQIPHAHAEVIDLTMTSTKSPSISEDAEDGKGGDGGQSNSHVMETRNRGARKSEMRAGSQQNNNATADAAAMTLRRSLEGLGEKSYLKRKKQSS